MTLTTTTYGKRNIGGAYVHYVERDGETIGSIHEIRETGAYYVKPYARGRMYADNTRYRSLEKALQSPEFAAR